MSNDGYLLASDKVLFERLALDFCNDYNVYDVVSSCDDYDSCLRVFKSFVKDFRKSCIKAGFGRPLGHCYHVMAISIGFASYASMKFALKEISF